MHSILNKLIVGVVGLCTFILNVNSFAVLSANATELVRLDQKVNAFINFGVNDSVFLISEKGNSFWLNSLKNSAGKTYNIDPACNISTQNTVAMDAGEGGMVLAYPYFVGIGKLCQIDELTNRIRLVSSFSNQLPQNPFSLSFAGSDDTSLYFILNGRPYPNGNAGYISALVVNKATSKVVVKNLLTDVPGFSAAMIYDNDQLWITSWLNTNDIYKISSSKLLAMIKASAVSKFSDIAAKAVGGFEGMSSFAFKNQTGFLFYNAGFDSYSVSLANGNSTPATLSCEPIAPAKTQWLFLCDGNRLEVRDL